MPRGPVQRDGVILSRFICTGARAVNGNSPDPDPRWNLNAGS